MSFEEITTLESLFQAWNEFKKGKRNKQDVMEFERNLEDNLFELHKLLTSKTYQHGGYKSFFVYDPKLRHIHKAKVADRVIHHLLYSYLYPLFDKTFIFDSYSCRLNKGTHRGVKRLEKFARIVSQNYSRDCWALKLDIKKFFASVDQNILMKMLEKQIYDHNILGLLRKTIYSFDQGIPLGNLTSQIFANIYLNELDQFIKHRLKVKYYLRYADDFVMLSSGKKCLENMIEPIRSFLKQELNLELHPQKIVLRNLRWGIDFLGYIILPHYILPRTKTKRRVYQKLRAKINSKNFDQSLQSYLGYLSHANSYKITQDLKSQLWLLK